MHIGFSIAAYSGRSRAAIRRHMRATMLDALPADPWMRSTLLGLALHRRRQLWVARVLKSELGVDLAMLAARGAHGDPRKIPPKGKLPHAPNWTYVFHGIVCALANWMTGELAPGAEAPRRPSAPAEHNNNRLLD